MKQFGILVFSIVCSLSLCAQNNLLEEETFSAYSEYLFNEYGIVCKIPHAFTNLDEYNVFWKIRKNKEKHTGNVYGLTLLSKDKQCIVMYSAFPRPISKEDMEMRKQIARPVYPRSQIIAELKTALGLYYHPHSPLNNDSADFYFNDFVTIVSGNEAGEMFNADSIYIYTIPDGDSVYFFNESLEKKRMDKYPHCASLFISKKERASMDIKFFFTKKSKKNEEKYISMLRKQIWYQDDFKH